MNFEDKANFTRAMLDVYDIYSKAPDDRTTALYFELLKDYELSIILKALESELRENTFFPKPADIIKKINYILEKEAPEQAPADYSEYTWIMSISPEEAQYFGHKLEGWQKENLLKKLNKSGITEFKNPDENPGIIHFNKLLDNGIIQKGIINIKDEL